MSCVSSSGFSIAEKWPPSSNSDQWTMLLARSVKVRTGRKS
ncbi:hypothetical protein [Actinacidiphila soli]|nr:hypothetical protein [Actinacidiphila soli]